ncbi:YdeI/OmpD-associated family protein [Rhizobium sp. LjRoot254]|uniref:YdeI/OmpD-associated family protein n=1 Tax=Rhizobium sp. LjRoot254 TaxID=3342297 RepID=UPI003ED01249
MAKSETNPKVDAFLARTTEWHAEIEALRRIILDCQLTEDFKWGWPCYSIDKKNVVLTHGFKDYCALLLFKGALMKDPEKILIQQTENVQAARQIRFSGLAEIKRMDNILKDYIHQAIDVEKAGLKVDFKDTKEFAMPEEFQAKLDAMPELKTAFHALTPGRQRGYLLHFSSAKQAKTREARIAKCMPRILDGKGLDD